MILRRTVCLLAPALLLAACGDKDEPATPAADDPAMAGALGGQVLTDPDLAGENGANRAASLPSANGAVPAADMSPEALAAARGAALKLVGGPGAMKKAPEAREGKGPGAADSQLTAAARAATGPNGKNGCSEKVTYTAAWAAKLPGAFPVYPRGAVQEAAGTDDGGCHLRVVNFISPVPVAEMIDFYYTRASAAGFSARHLRDGSDDMLSWTKGAASYVVMARDLPNGGSSVDLVTNGG
jgi:hypothetical protein